MPTITENPVDIARRNASLRDQFISRGLATAEQLDQVGFVSHSQLDLWAEGGALQEAVEKLEEAWGLGLLHGHLFDMRIIRGEHGHFGGVIGSAEKPPSLKRRVRSAVPHVPHANRTRQPHTPGPRVKVDVPTHTDGAPSPRAIRTLTGKRGTLKNRKFKVFPTVAPDPNERSEGSIPDTMSVDQAKAESNQRGDTHGKLIAAGDKRLGRLAREARRRSVDAHKRGDFETRDKLTSEAEALEKSRGTTKDLIAHGQKELYDRRTKALNRRIDKSTQKAAKKGTLRAGPTPAAGATRGQHELTAAEAHFNDAGHVSQRTLLAYANDAASQPTTAEMYRNADGSWHPSRAALHAHIIDQLLRKRNADRSFSPTNEHLQAPEGAPTVKFLGGAYASGKGGLGKLLRSQGRMPEGALELDPDEIKAMLPEFQHGAMTDPEANLRVYEEAWEIAQHAMAEAQKRHLHVVVDGITNTSAEEVAKRIASFTEAGYKEPEIHYVSIPTEEAISRAKGRAARGETAADRRMIPDVIMRAVHRDVSATIPRVMARSKQMGAAVHVWDNFQPQDPVTGQNGLPQLVASASPAGQVTHHDPQAFGQVLNKALEKIPGVSEPQTDVQTLDGGAQIPTEAEAAVGKALAKAIPDPHASTRQPTSDLGELLSHAQSTQPHFAKLLSTLGESISAQVHDLSEGGDFAAIGQSVEQDASTSHVIIAPPKTAQAAAAKAKQEAAKVEGVPPNDASLVTDVVRGTVTVPKGGDIATIAGTLGKLLRKQGWQIADVKNRLADNNGSTRFPTNGYGDYSLILRAPKDQGGLACELQINTNPMWWMKEMGPGHNLFEEERAIRRSLAPGQEPDPSQREQLQSLQAQAKALYDTAWAMALATSTNDPEILKATARHVRESTEIEESGFNLTFDPVKHPRGWHGHFAQVLAQLPKPNLRGRGGGEVHVEGAHTVKRTRHGFEVSHPEHASQTFGSAEEAAKHVHDHVESEKLRAAAKADLEAEHRDREQRRAAREAEHTQRNAVQTWFRFEPPEVAEKIAKTGEVWGLPGQQGRGSTAVRAQPRRPDESTIAHERDGGRVLVEFHTVVAPDDTVGKPHFSWSPAAVRQRNRTTHGTHLRVEPETTKHGRVDVAKLKVHGVRIIR